MKISQSADHITIEGLTRKKCARMVAARAFHRPTYEFVLEQYSTIEGMLVDFGLAYSPECVQLGLTCLRIVSQPLLTLRDSASDAALIRYWFKHGTIHKYQRKLDQLSPNNPQDAPMLARLRYKQAKALGKANTLRKALLDAVRAYHNTLTLKACFLTSARPELISAAVHAYSPATSEGQILYALKRMQNVPEIDFAVGALTVTWLSEEHMFRLAAPTDSLLESFALALATLNPQFSGTEL